jgi:S-adenosylmethionine-diacylglycerol 3-amino-3-carboxypropyl transferase
MNPAPAPWAVRAARFPLAFAQVREDPRIDVQLARHLPDPATIVMIASGGDTVVQLGRLPLHRIHAVDMNPAQIAISRLKWHLAHQPDPRGTLALLGHQPLPPAERQRELLGLFDTLKLSHDALGPLDQVAELGPDHSGRYELCFDQLRQQLNQKTAVHLTTDVTDGADEGAAPPGPVRVHGLISQLHGHPTSSPRPSASSASSAVSTAHSRSEPAPDPFAFGPELDLALASVMSRPNLVALFGEEATRNPLLPFSTHFAQRTRIAAARPDAGINPFLWQMYRGRFPSGHPHDWLQPGPSPQADVVWHHGRMRDVLRSMPTASADFVHLSNILDWLSPQDAEDTLAATARVLRTGGTVIVRQLNSSLAMDALCDDLRWNRELGAEWVAKDRSFFYPRLHIGNRR